MKNNINLPMFETVYRSFTCVLKNFKPFLKICSFFIILWFIELATNLPSLCSADEAYCRTDKIGNLMTVIHYLAATIVSVSVIRFIILKEKTSWFHVRFGKNNIKFIAYNLLIALMIIIPSALMIMIGGAAKYSGSSPVTTKLFASLGILTFIGLCVYCFRLCLVYAGSAINDKSMTLSKSHTLTNGNVLKIFFGQILLVIPTIIIVTIVYKVYTLTEWNYVGKSIFVLAGILLSFFDSAVKASYYSHMYQYFIYFSNKQNTTVPQIKGEPVAKTVTVSGTTSIKTEKKQPVKKAVTKKTATKKAPVKADTKTKSKPTAKKAATTKTATKTAVKKEATTKSATPKKKEATTKAIVKSGVKTTKPAPKKPASKSGPKTKASAPKKQTSKKAVKK